MGGPNKLLAEIGGRPLVRIAAEQALASRARPVIVVTGHQRERVEAALAGLDVRFVHNPDYADGSRTSLKAGIAAVPADADGAIVCLGDMPQVDAALIDRLIAAFDPEKGALVVVPSIDGKRGNPVVWSRRFFPELDGRRRRRRRPPPDRQLSARRWPRCRSTGRAALTDVDTPEALSGQGRTQKDLKAWTCKRTAMSASGMYSGHGAATTRRALSTLLQHRITPYIVVG